jgi:hypothetical protein
LEQTPALLLILKQPLKKKKKRLKKLRKAPPKRAGRKAINTGFGGILEGAVVHSGTFFIVAFH